MIDIKTRLAALLSVKSIVTLTLTMVFAWLALQGKIGQQDAGVMIHFHIPLLSLGVD